jgi:hypothetical protein
MRVVRGGAAATLAGGDTNWDGILSLVETSIIPTNKKRKMRDEGSVRC